MRSAALSFNRFVQKLFLFLGGVVYFFQIN